jgi:hypothetical protein
LLHARLESGEFGGPLALQEVLIPGIGLDAASFSLDDGRLFRVAFEHEQWLARLNRISAGHIQLEQQARNGRSDLQVLTLDVTLKGIGITTIAPGGGEEEGKRQGDVREP